MKTTEANMFSPTDFPLPSVIDSPYPVVAIGDLHEVGQSIAPIAPNITRDESKGFEDELAVVRNGFAPEGSTFYEVSAGELVTELVTED